MHRLNIGILFGGASSEHEVSLESAYSVIKNIDIEKYQPILIGINKEGKWFRFLGDIEDIKNNKWEENAVPVILSQNRKENRDFTGIIEFHKDKIQKSSIDLALPILHGKNGEDGSLQGLFETMNIPLIGCGILSSSLCMDKRRAQQLVNAFGVKVAQSIVLKKNEDLDMARIKEELVFGYPVYVKPVKAGSSIGISRVTEEEDLEEAIKLAFAEDDVVTIEEEIRGFEVGCAILGNGSTRDQVIIGDIDEIQVAEGFFDFKEKYTLETSKIHVPARISEDKAEKIKDLALKIYNILDCQDFARVDLFIKENQELYFNEINTIPGFTESSRYPNMLQSAGYSYQEIVDKIIEAALIRNGLL